MRKSYPKNSKAIPTGVLNVEGKVTTNPKEKKNVRIKHFEHRMRKREVKEEFKDLIEIEKVMCNKRIRTAQQYPSPPFTMT